MDTIEESIKLLNVMTEAEQIDYYIKSYNNSKVYYRESILRLMTTNGETRDDIVNNLNEEILQIDKNLIEIYKYKQDLERK